MAEENDNDMSQQHQQQVEILQEKEADRPREQPNCSSTVDETATLKQTVTTVSSGTGISGQKKKSSFEITSVTETKVHNRGGSNGYLEDELNEHDESDLLDVELEVEPVDEKANGNGVSRFKVVRITRNAQYSRGRWECHDFIDSESSSSTSISTATSASNIGIHSQKDNSDRQDITNVYSSTSTHSISNHIPHELISKTDRATPPLESNSKTLPQETQGQTQSALDSSSRRKDLPEPRGRGTEKIDSYNSHRTASETTSDRPSERIQEATRR